MNTFSGAINGAIQGWNARDYIPAEVYGWDTYRARASRYNINSRYYNNQAYDSINTYVAAMIHQKGLYKHIRSIRNPIPRAVDFFVSKVYDGALDMETAETGAIPLQADKRIRDAVIKYWDASNFSVLRNIYVRDGATLGDVFIKNVNDGAEGCIYMEMVHPLHVTEFTLDKQQNITSYVIEYMEYENTVANARPYVHKEICIADGIKTYFATYKDNKPFAYYNDENGKPLPEWETDYGFAPLIQAQHTNLGLKCGAAAFQTAIRKVDELDDAASLLNDQIRNAVQVAFLMPGTSGRQRTGETAASSEPTITFNRDEKTNIPIIHAGKDANAIPLIADINIGDALKTIESIEASIEREMPELALYHLWDAQQISGVAVSKLYDPVVSRVKLARANYDDALVRSQQMAIAMGAYHGYADYAGFSVEDYRKGNLRHTIKERAVFDDRVERPAKILALQTVKDQPTTIATLILEELDYSQQTIKEVTKQLDEQAAQAEEAAARAFMQSALGDDDDNAQTDNEEQPANRAAKTRQNQTARQP